jgi:serine/threonine-protein kinase
VLVIAEHTIIARKYRLERLLARGGMGEVWAARDEHLGRPVALKFIDPKLDDSELRARFEREAQAAARLATPHVVQIFEHGVDADRPYIVMELLEGETLASRLKREPRLSLSEAATLTVHIGRALRKAHNAGIVHRDLKPLNIFLARTDDEVIAKVLDFGVAKARLSGDEVEATLTGDVLGSPKYMSPEQAQGLRSVDHRSDLFSLGVILFRVVTGHMPFRGESAVAVGVSMCTEGSRIATQLAPDLPPDIDAFFSRALALETADRFQNVGELVEAFVAITGARETHAGTRAHAPAPATPPAPSTSAGTAMDEPTTLLVSSSRPREASQALRGATLDAERWTKRGLVFGGAGIAAVAAAVALFALRAHVGGSTTAAAPSQAAAPAVQPAPPAADAPAESAAPANVTPPAQSTTTAAADAAPMPSPSARPAGAPPSSQEPTRARKKRLFNGRN